MTIRFTPLASEDPREIGGYQLRARLGGGGMGRVYLSFTPGGRALAIKVIRPEYAEDEVFRRRFHREVAVAQRVQGMFTAPVVKADPTAALPWLATAYVPGPSLREAVDDHGVLPPLAVFRLVAGVAEGLLAVHACGIVHRDLKPANVLLAEDGPRVIDFGIAYAAEATTLTGTGVTVGTPAFIAPEQIRGGSATPATDVFGLGHLAVFAATGRPAFGEGDRDALLYRITREPPELDDCPDPVRDIAERCLAKDPNERPGLAEVRDYARRHINGQTLNLAGPWLPAAIAESLASYDAAEYRLREADRRTTTVDADPGKSNSTLGRQPESMSSGNDRTGRDDADGELHPTGGSRPIGGSNIDSAHAQPATPGRVQRTMAAGALAALIAAAVAVVVLAVLTAPKNLPARDDTLHPEEIPSIFLPQLRDELLEGTSSPPEPSWTIPMGDGSTHAIGGDSTIVMLQFGTYLLGIDMRTGKQRWPFINLHDTPTSCAVHENRIGCVASSDHGSDSTVFILDTASGRTVKTSKVPNRELRWMTVSGDRFIAITQPASKKKGFGVGYTTEGDQVWTREGYSDMHMSASEGLLIDTAYDSDEVVFVSTSDGREVVRSSRGDRELAWSIFSGGIAISNQEGTGTDIYDLDGEKRSSVAGWEPARYMKRYGSTSPLPLLVPLGDSPPHYPDENTIAAANPKTGHLLWRKSGPEVSTQMATVADKLIIKDRQEFVRVYDCISGKPLSPPINMEESGFVGLVEPYLIKSDGYQLIYTYLKTREKLAYVTVAFDMSSGERRWELPLRDAPEYPGGRMVGVGKPGTISLFR
ncbi:serine/threonine-protein kinase [Spirillospora sp. NPDC048819]|uniref:serine/threonine-protein kinase n=1 Tax=Spirillospora sp. NPDC048819 TaxID=3155268 RepID=UPI0033C137A7